MTAHDRQTWLASSPVLFVVFEIMQICGESVGVKVKRYFVVEPLGERRKMPRNTGQDKC